MVVLVESPQAHDLTELSDLVQAAELLKALAHPHRLRMIQMLLAGQYAVGELAQACGIASAAASEHLRMMQQCGLLTSEKEHRKKYYHVADVRLATMMSIVEAGFCRRS